MRLNRIFMPLPLAALALLLSASVLHAQFTGPDNTTKVNDPTFLKPPPGVKVALIEFEDLECPSCGHFAPIVRAELSRYKSVVYLRHDFPLPQHMWAYDAAIDARWFEGHSFALGEEYRLAVFSHQTAISTRDDLLGFTQRFAGEHGLAWPFVVDPTGELQAKVKRDMTLGNTKVNIDHTPTIWVVTRARAVEIKEPEQIDPAIRAALAEAGVVQIGGQ